VRYDKEGRLSSIEVSGDPAAVHQVLGQLLRLNHAPPPSQAPEQPPPEPRRRRAGASAQPQRQEQEGLPEFARDNPWLEVLSRKS